jgi:hypothetical protein
VALLLLASVTMLAAVPFGIRCELDTHIPDILCYCSSLTRDSRYLGIRGGSTLDGMDRARKLRDFPGRLGVVGPDEAGISRLVVADPEIVREPARGTMYA